jgi:hypothetical protein
MTTAGQALAEALEAPIDRLYPRSTAALYWACSSGLMPAYQEWAAATGARTGTILNAALAEAYDFALWGHEPEDQRELLQALEDAAPPGDFVDQTGTRLETAAQDCWICGDVGIRVLADPGYRPGGAIWYALEPVLQYATERLFGVLQTGSGPGEDRQTEAVMAQPEVAEAADFLRWAVDHLAGRPALASTDLNTIRQRALVLRPPPGAGSRWVAGAVSEDHFEFDATPEAQDYLSEIAAKMTRLFAISRAEAIGRMNKLWSGRCRFRTEMEVSLLFHELPRYWANQVYYRDDTRWWHAGEELVPRDYP